METKRWKGKFALLWGGQAISLLTSSVLQMAIVWYITERTGSAILLTLSTLVGFLPHAVLGIFIGALIDRYDRKVIMIGSDLVIAAAGLALALVGIWHQIPIWLIYVVLFIRSIGSAFHTPSLDAVIPLIVPEEQLGRCAGYAQGFRSASMVLSPAIAAVLFAVWDLNVIILLDVAGAAIAMTIVWLTKIPKIHGEGRVKPETGILEETRDGLRILRRTRGMTALMIVCALYSLVYFPIGTLYPHITMTYFGGGVTQSGTVEVIFSVGMLAGSLLLGVVGSRIHKPGAICASIGLYGLGVLITGCLPPGGLRIFMALSFFMGITTPFFHGMKTAILQIRIPKDYLGRVLSLSNSITMAAMPVGLVLAGGLADKIGVDRWFVYSGAFAVGLALFGILTPSMRNCCRNKKQVGQ